MARPDKVAAVADVRERLEGSNATVLTEYRGLTVGELAQLRAELRKAGAEYRVVKNTLTKIAVRDAGYDLPAELLTGPTAVTFCADDPVAAAKVLRAFSRENPNLVVKAGILEGRLIDAAETLRLADLASREELLATMAGMMQTIIAQPARLALANLTKAARLLAALQEKRQATGETTATAPAAAGTEEDISGEAPSADETPAPDSPEAEAATAEAEGTDGVDATAGATGPEGPAANTAPERAAEKPSGDDATDQADVDAAAQAANPEAGT